MPRPDDGLIHAWLDGQLPPEEAARVEALAAADPEWAAAVAEARGLVAASSRILSALDHVPASVVPRGAVARTGQRLPWWTKIAAAVVVVVGGSVVVMQRMPETATPIPMDATAREAEVVQAPAAAEQPVGASAAPRRDALPSTVMKPPSAPSPAALNAVKSPAPISVAQEAPRAAPAEPRGKQLEKVAVPLVTPPVPAMLAENTKDATSEARSAAQPRARTVGGVAGVAGVAGGGRVAEVPGAARMALTSKSVTCYRLERDRVPSGVIGIMRSWRTDGDTLRLEPAQDLSRLRAWIVRRDSVWRGVAIPVSAGRDTIPVIALRVACPAP